MAAMRRGDLAKATGSNIETIRYYEKIGLLPDPARSASGHRLYSPNDEKRLTFVLRCRQLGFSIAELRGLLQLVDSADYSCSDVLAVTTQHMRNIERKIADLRRLKKSLEDISAECSGDQAPDCPIIEALYA